MTASPSQESTSDDLAWGAPPLPFEDIEVLFVALEKALRAYELYDARNPSYQRFLEHLRDAFEKLWVELGRLVVSVEESALLVEDHVVYEREEKPSSLAFLMYKDGLREITFFPGVERYELEPLLQVLGRARMEGPEGDDLLNGLWEADLDYLEYRWIDVHAEGLALPEPGRGTDPEVLEEIAREGRSVSVREEDGSPVPLVGLDADDRRQFALDERDMERFRGEIEREMSRDVQADVLAALFDRLEDPEFPEQQPEIVEIFRTLLPNFLSAGDVGSAGRIIDVLGSAESDTDRFGPEVREEISNVLDEVSAPETLAELLTALGEGTLEPSPEELGYFLSHLRPTALEPLLRASGSVAEGPLKKVIQESVGALGSRHPELVIELVADEGDPAVVRGALRLIADLKIEGAASILAELVGHRDASIRLAAIEAGTDLRASIVAGALEPRLRDEEVEVRLAALRALTELAYRPASSWLKPTITGRAIRSAELREKIAFFEAFGSVADESEIPVLEKLLAGTGRFLSEPRDIRACAALALGKMRAPAARAVLEETRDVDDPVVRNAVRRALAEGRRG